KQRRQASSATSYERTRTIWATASSGSPSRLTSNSVAPSSVTLSGPSKTNVETALGPSWGSRIKLEPSTVAWPNSTPGTGMSSKASVAVYSPLGSTTIVNDPPGTTVMGEVKSVTLVTVKCVASHAPTNGSIAGSGDGSAGPESPQAATASVNAVAHARRRESANHLLQVAIDCAPAAASRLAKRPLTSHVGPPSAPA